MIWMLEDRNKIGAVVLAAGESLRMGVPKLALPWGDSTVIGTVISTLKAAGVSNIVAVTGGAKERVEAALAAVQVQTVYNAQFSSGDMLSSLQTGLVNLPMEVEAALVVLGDQPQIQAEVVAQVIYQYLDRRARLVIPSYVKRRGHPWLVDKRMWHLIMALKAPDTLRSFIQQHANAVDYVNVDTPSILKDLDTPQDYERDRP